MEDHLVKIVGGHDTKEVSTKFLSTDTDLLYTLFYYSNSPLDAMVVLMKFLFRLFFNKENL